MCTCFLSCSLTPLVSPLSDLASLSPSHSLPVPTTLSSPFYLSAPFSISHLLALLLPPDGS